MPWQQLVLDVALEHDDNGALVYRETVVTVPRQSGKTTLMVPMILWRALQGPRVYGQSQVVLYTAQTGADARDKWMDDWLPMLDPEQPGGYFRKYLKNGKPRLTNGHEALVFTNGSRQILATSKKSSGHGKSLDLAIIDEAWSQKDDRVEQSFGVPMITRRSPQAWVLSTAGTPEESPYLLAKVEQGRALVDAGVTKGVAYFEWSAPDELDPSDPATWWSCMPALGHTVTEEAVAAEFARMANVNEFERAYLNRWKVGRADPVIPLDAWHACGDPTADRPCAPIFFSLDITPDRDSGSIALCGSTADGLPFVEITDNRPGVEWMAGRIKELVDRYQPAGVICDSFGATGAVLPDLQRLGVEPTLIGAREMGAACGLFYDHVIQGRIRHLDTIEMTRALDGAKQRPIGDAWAWARRGMTVDISPLVASTVALWGWSQYVPPKPRVRLL